MLYENYAQCLQNAIDSIRQTQGEKIMRAAEIAADVICADGLIYIFGCGHSGILAHEGFYRAGGLACVAPIFCEPLMLHESASKSSRLEKESGYAERLLDAYSITKKDMLLCFSTSDKNAVPVEYASAITASGVPTVAVCSSAYFGQEVHNACGRHLHEVCTMYIDNMAPFGDACLHLEGAAADITPVSTVTGVYILNSILAESVWLALKRGADVPIYMSGNVPGGAERNADLIERYSKRIPHL